MTIPDPRATYRGQRPYHVTIPDVLATPEATALRARVAPGLVLHDVPDRGRFRVADATPEPALFARLLALAESVTGCALRIGAHRWTRLAHGDYALLLADAWLRAAGAHVEVLLDLSPAATGEADVVYIDQGALAVVAQQPASATIVGRRASTWRFDRYLTSRVGAAEVWRLRLALLPVRRRAGSAGRPTGARGRGSRSGARGGR